MERMEAKTFQTDVRGECKDADPMGFGCNGHWCWGEAKEKLLKRCDKWRDERMESGERKIKIISAYFHKWTGAGIDEGATLELEIIYEA